MKKPMQMGCAVIALSALIIGGVKFFEPASAMQSAAAAAPAARQSVQQDGQHQAVQQNQPAALNVKNAIQPELLQERDELFKEFEGISYALSHGEQLDTRAVDSLLQRQLNLVQAGALSADDAIAYSQFLRKIMPDMERGLDRHIQQLEQIKGQTSA